MGGKQNHNDKRVRLLIAQEAAKIMYEQSIRDYRSAKNKACLRLGYSHGSPLPSNVEIQEALQEYIRLFKSEEQVKIRREYYREAKLAMNFLQEFNPRLVGAVVNGTANEQVCIHLHVFADTSEEVILFLSDKGISFDVRDAIACYSEGKEDKVATLNFIAGTTPVEISIFPIDGLRRAPNSPVDGKPMKRLSVSELNSIL